MSSSQLENTTELIHEPEAETADPCVSALPSSQPEDALEPHTVATGQDTDQGIDPDQPSADETPVSLEESLTEEIRCEALESPVDPKVTEPANDAPNERVDEKLQEILSFLGEFEGRLNLRLDGLSMLSGLSDTAQESSDSEWPASRLTADDRACELPGQHNFDDHDDSTEAADAWAGQEHNDYALHQLDQLTAKLLHLEEELQAERNHSHELQTQNDALAAEIASSGVQGVVSDSQGCDESMSWEERKARILEQMEQDDFNAESFLESLSQSSQEVVETIDPAWQSNPVAFIDDLVGRLSQAEQTISERNAEIKELQILLQNRQDTRNDHVAFGAAAIAGMVDSDELVIAERERLAQLKSEWEDKFRSAEIEVSLERAKLSRERQELAKRSEELEEELERLQREKREARDQPKTGRRWLAELGLQSDGE
ncbi:hypothetical protein [Rhodopirellula halodulae]|uniref:hypothetical protein n=1 Tax=Rhodopirellula halodulae TaxID=2894198 RepID=UPI001E55A881|nr:hypothetical protein [Rhodopirellula sp. JC737]MCC9655582.1 hypothetical protein [Rhodopirellula sp. JC737]